MVSEEVLRAVFPLLEGVDLASCMIVSKQWRDVASDDYVWKSLCSKGWPSMCKRPNPPTVTYYKLYQTFYRRQCQHRRTLLPPRISFDDLEFFIDIWADKLLVFSEVVPGCDSLKFHFDGLVYKMSLPVESRFTISLGQTQNMSVSVMVGRKDTNKVARIINKSFFAYIHSSSCRAAAFDNLDISPAYPFLLGIRAWLSLLFIEDGNEEVINVFEIQMDFSDVAKSKEEVLWLLDMLDWK